MARYTVPGNHAVLYSDMGRVLYKDSVLIGSGNLDAANQNFIAPRRYVYSDIAAIRGNRSSG
jgi:hypothetical protein